MKHLSYLIKPASSSCNMRCRYCFYEDVSSLREVPTHGIMERSALAKLIQCVYQDLDAGDHLALAFQGGEPTLAGLDYFRDLISAIALQEKPVHVSYSIQTNGILLDDEWAVFLKKHDFLVGLSMDSEPVTHDANRLDLTGAGTSRQVRRAWQLLRKYEIPTSILTVLTRQLASDPGRVMDHLIAEEIPAVQFIPCLAPLADDRDDPYALTPELFASFYNELFQRWLGEIRKGHAINIQFFDGVLELLATGQEILCGLKGRCQVQNVVEADGSLYPCDFYVLDQYRMGSLLESPAASLRQSPGAIAFLTGRPEPAALCERCPYLTLCHGGCPRMRHSMYLDETETFCGYRDFLDQNMPTLRILARQLV